MENPRNRRCLHREARRHQGRGRTANIITRDAATGLQSIFTRDLKQRTVICQDVHVDREAGDRFLKNNSLQSRIFAPTRVLAV
jgi:hypothetical protein